MRCHICGALMYGPPHLLVEWKCLNNDCEVGLKNLEASPYEKKFGFLFRTH